MSEETASVDESLTAGLESTDNPQLDDVMLAMDVVDTLRRRERLVVRELDEAGREEDLKQRLRRIYAQQGIEVPDHVLEQGVAALKEDRFTYKAPKPSLATRLAYLYINRGKWGKWVGGILGAGILAGITNYFAFVAPRAALPEDLASMHQAVLALSESDNARSTAERIFKAGQAAIRDEDTEGAKSAIEGLGDLRNQLEQEYTILIVNREGVRTGVWRVPDVNSQARNHYIIVEAVDATGKVLTVPIKNEETGKTEQVNRWGIRVDEATFASIANDKKDNGIIENDRFGYKRQGYLIPSYEIRTTGGAITQW